MHPVLARFDVIDHRTMAIELRRPHHLRIGVARAPEATPRRPTLIGVSASIALRGLLVGMGIGTLLMTSGQSGVASLTVLGVLALGAAMMSWDR